MKPVPLSLEAQDILRDVRARDPLFANSGQAEEFAARNTFGSLRVLPRTDGMFIVYDERLPLRDRTVSVHPSEDEARHACRKLT